MAQFDQGGGCACGLYKVCSCEHSTTRPIPKKIDVRQLGRVMPARIKIADAMVEAAVLVFSAQADEAGHPVPDEDEHPEQWDSMRAATRKALRAAADAIT